MKIRSEAWFDCTCVSDGKKMSRRMIRKLWPFLFLLICVLILLIVELNRVNLSSETLQDDRASVR